MALNGEISMESDSQNMAVHSVHANSVPTEIDDQSPTQVGFDFPTVLARVRDEDALIRRAIEDEMESLDEGVRDMALKLLGDDRYREFAELRAIYFE